jgi:Glycerol dehydrogenase and related enzymes
MRIFAATPLYMQGPNVIDQVGAVAARIGCVPGIVIDAQVYDLVGRSLESGFATRVTIASFSAEVTDMTVTALGQALEGCDVIVAVGGGKAIDAGKAVALRLGTPVISVPTIASTDGPASRGIAMYDDAHRLVRVDQMPANPAAVIVDSQVIAQAPVRFLRAGVGDAIAKTFEAEACWAGSGLTKHGTRPSYAGRAVARVAYQMLRDHAITGLADAERHQVTEALEATIEACVLLSAMGFENGGLSVAHSVTRGLMTLRGARERLHGEHVAYGALVQLATEQRGEALADLATFLEAAGLPTSLTAMGVDDPTDGDIVHVATATMTSPHMRTFARPLAIADIVRAVTQVEQLAGRPNAQPTHI